jgi:phosphonopyruvate decarboxylase
MSASLELLETLKALEIRCYATFPDKWLAPMLRALDGDCEIVHVPATIEREALGIAVGTHLAGMRSAIVMQNSGIGNLLNDWASLAFNYGIPVPWIVSDRGSAGELVATQTIWHSRLGAVLDAVGIPALRFTSPAELGELARFVQLGYSMRRSVAALFPHAFWQDDAGPGRPATAPAPGYRAWSTSVLSARPINSVRNGSRSWRRYEALECLLNALGHEFLFVTLGDPAKEAYAIRDRAETFYMLGSMGLVLPLGLGFARARAALGRTRKTVVVDGDGSQLMQLGSLGTLSREQPDLALVVIDNGSYGSTGDQPTLTRSHVDLEAVAHGFGLADTASVHTPLELERRLGNILSAPGPSVTIVVVAPGAPVTPLVPLPAARIAERFQAAAACEAATWAAAPA